MRKVHKGTLGDTGFDNVVLGIFSVESSGIFPTNFRTSNGKIFVVFAREANVGRINGIAVWHLNRDENRRGVHNHAAIEHAIAIADEEGGVKTPLLGDKIVCAVDQGVDALGNIGLLIILDIGYLVARGEGIAIHLVEHISTAIGGLLESIVETFLATLGINSTKFVIFWLISWVEEKAKF